MIVPTFEEFARDIGMHRKDAIKREIREMKINILEGKYMCTDAYSIPEKPMMWEPCPTAGPRRAGAATAGTTTTRYTLRVSCP